jgi:hypothetical protein
MLMHDSIEICRYDDPMRTTVTLDPDVEKLLRDAMARSKRSFKQVLNDAVRRGLEGRGGQPEPRFEVRSRPMSLRPGLDPTRPRDLDDELEVEEFLRKTRAIERRRR